MSKNIMAKNLRQSIKTSLGRYIAIVAIIALGSAIFVGLRTTKSDMVATGQSYMDSQNMFDFRLLNTYGWTEESLDSVSQIEGVTSAEGVISLDVLAMRSDSDAEGVYKLYSIPETVNKVYLLGGRMPEAPDECLADGFHATDAILGTTYTVTERNDEDTLNSLKYHTYTVVGYVSTPLYMDMSRGSTTLGNGSVSSYLYIPEESFDVDYYTEIDVTVTGDHTIYTEAYNTALDDAADRIEQQVSDIAYARYSSILQEAEQDYQDGLSEYRDGLEEYEEGKREAEESLEEARQELLNAEDEVSDGWEDLDNARIQLINGQQELDSYKETLEQTRLELEAAKTDTYAQLDAAKESLDAQRQTVTSTQQQVQDSLAQINAAVPDLNGSILQLEQGIAAEGTPPEVIAQLESKLADLYALREQKTALEDQQLELAAALPEIDAGMAEVEAGRQDADAQFAAMEAEIAEGETQLEDAQQEIYRGWQDIAEGEQSLKDAEAEIADGWEEYEKGKLEAEQELADAEVELADAKTELDDARKEIDDIGEPDVYMLDRNTNVGYLSLDSNSNIVAGISAVFPAFFLLVAALVCITTMTRMVEEERTQIGTLKALGYSNLEIIGKYLAYAGSAAIMGCGLGVLVGSVVFPLILWEAYSIILNLTPQMVLQLDLGLCIPVVVAYTAVTLLVTWYCCRMVLRDVPAELIRPKPPTSGKKIFLEYLPFWNKIKFLNKVMLRNVFRYRQRLLMMLVGIGGCTALLVTGFGVKDSIMDIVSIQFDEVTMFDMEVRFSDGLDANGQAEFMDEVGQYTEDVGFFYQSSVEVDFENATKEITMVASNAEIESFFDFHSGDTALVLPQKNEAMISVGVAEMMGISVGDTITVRNADMETMNVTVSSIFDNHVSNYVIVMPQTLAEQWGEEPQSQMAYITVADGEDVHGVGAKVAELDNVVNVSISADLAEQVGTMMEALNLVVITVVICAGMLAVTVLYNLTNINITERIREIATIKVLGFQESESAAYVFKENLLLSGMGALVGLLGGYGLLSFVMSQIKVDMVWFEARVLPQSYVWAILLTMLSACLVDFVLYFKLGKINMAEALKSVE